MSRERIRRTLLAVVFAAAASLAAYGASQAASVADLLAQGALAPQAPALLGPITSAGRKGWECKPEIAAAAKGAHQAELPPPDASPTP
ncbi:MAG TPA: hypothetical protein VGF18_08180 [Candidatus Tumulicola sp.]